MIPVYKPYLKNFKKSAIEAINSEWISNHGLYINLTSEKLKNIFGVKHCILMNNGTSATQCLLYSIKYLHPSISKIYVPNNVFISPINCVLNVYKKEQLEVMKIIPSTLNIETSEDYILSLDKNSAVLIVHNLGNIINVPRLSRIRPDIVFVEDNCEGIFGMYEEKMAGTQSLCSSLSFYGNKTITSGEGGAFLTNNTQLYNYIYKLYSHGMTTEKYIHDTIGNNYRMTNVSAAILYEQLCDIGHILCLKARIFQNYKKIISGKSDSFKNKLIKIQSEVNTKKSMWMYCMIVRNINYKSLERFMEESQIQIRPFFYDLRKHKHLSDLNYKYTKETIFSNGFMLPSYPELTYKQQEYIVNKIEEFTDIYLK